MQRGAQTFGRRAPTVDPMRIRVAGGRSVVGRGAVGVVAVLAILGAGCAHAGSGAPNDAISSSTTTTEVSGPREQPGAQATGSTVPDGRGSTRTTAGGGPGGSGSSPTTTAAVPPVIGVGSTGVGGVASALLRPGRGDRVVLEVRAQQGAAPTSATIDHLAQVLGSASGKPVAVDGTDAIGGGTRDWTQQQIISAASAAAQLESGRAQVVLRLLFLRGTFGGDTSVLGVSVAGDVAAVFSDQVDSAAGLLVSPSVVEDAVSMHEVGHLLALVDLLLGTGRGDPAHPGHSRNKRSVMYWQVESDLITQLLEGGMPRDFDADDRAELAQIRAG